MRVLLLFCGLFIQLIGHSQLGVMFPGIKGKTLEDRQVKIPLKNEKFSLVAIAFSRDAESDLKSWLNPVFDLFIKTKGEPGAFDMADIYDINFMFVPMIAGFKKAAVDFKKGTDPEYWPYILDTDDQEIRRVQSDLGISNTSVPYFYLLDKSGKIIVAQSGAYSESKMSKIEDAIE